MQVTTVVLRRYWRRALTLVELLVVMAIIAVLMSILFPNYFKAIFKAQKVKTQVENRNQAIENTEE